jgi:hypothetical protein
MNIVDNYIISNYIEDVKPGDYVTILELTGQSSLIIGEKYEVCHIVHSNYPCTCRCRNYGFDFMIVKPNREKAQTCFTVLGNSVGKRLISRTVEGD